MRGDNEPDFGSILIDDKISDNTLYVGMNDPQDVHDQKTYVNEFNNINERLMVYRWDNEIKTVVLDLKLFFARKELASNDLDDLAYHFIGTVAAMPHVDKFVFIKGGDKYFGHSFKYYSAYEDKTTKEFQEEYREGWPIYYRINARAEAKSRKPFDPKVDFNRKMPIVQFYQ